MAVCPIHKKELNLHAWICPVCGSDRCEECEYIECVVDGRKKDYECSFKCEFCDAMAGNDRKVTCIICGATGCSECIRPNTIDHKPVCPDCGFMCVSCGKTYTMQHMKSCDICHSHVCSICQSGPCHLCNKSTCGAHSFICAGCGQPTCKECVGGVDAVSGKKLCKNCLYKCKSCGSQVPEDSVVVCAECNAEVCPKCMKKCDKCGKIYCKDHIYQCNNCDNNICVNHGDVCPACGGHSCNEHFFRCDMCGIGYCNKCRPYENENICNLCDSLSPLKTSEAKEFLERLKEADITLRGLGNWSYSKGREVFIFYGKGMLANYIIVADKKTGKILKSTKIGLMDKMKKMFS